MPRLFFGAIGQSQQLPDADTASQRFQVAVASNSMDPVSVVSPWHASVSALLAYFLCNTYYVANLCGSLCLNTTTLSHSTTISSTDSLLAVLKRWDSVVSWDFSQHPCLYGTLYSAHGEMLSSLTVRKIAKFWICITTSIICASCALCLGMAKLLKLDSIWFAQTEWTAYSHDHHCHEQPAYVNNKPTNKGGVLLQW